MVPPATEGGLRMEQAEFDLLARRAGLTLDAAVASELCRVAPHALAMAARNCAPRGREVEPAFGFALPEPELSA